MLAIVLALVVGTAATLPLILRGLGVVAVLGSGVLFRAEPIPSWIWFFAKTYALIFVLVWLRGTFPRLRVDQLMGFAWKFLLPLALLNIIAAGLWVAWPFPTGTAASAALLVGSYWWLVRVNRPARLERRTYVFAD